MDRTKPVLMMTSGIDSICTGVLLSDSIQILPVYFTGVSKYAEAERFALEKMLEWLNIGEVIFDNSLRLKSRELPGGFIPYRNLLFMLQAAKYGTEIIIGYVDGDNVNDNNPEAHKNFEKILNTYWDEGGPFTVKTIKDYEEKYFSKGELLREVSSKRGRHYAQDIVDGSFSCYEPLSNRECKKCPACFRKFIAAKAAGLRCEFGSRKLAIEYYEKMKTPEGEERYGKKRTEETLRVLHEYYGV